MSDDRPFVQSTLAWCNKRRIEQGKKPLAKMPKGNPRDPLTCPCGVAAGVAVGRSSWLTPEEYENRNKPGAINFGSAFDLHERRLPYTVRDFIREMDRGALPEYTLEEKPDV